MLHFPLGVPHLTSYEEARMKFFPQFPAVIALTSAKYEGAMGSSTNSGADGEFEQNRLQFLESNRIDPDSLVMAGLVHGKDVAVVTEIPPEKRIPNVDALVTSTPGIALGIATADCNPVFLHDPPHGVIGIAHAGWRGTLNKVVLATIARMGALGARRESIRVAIGPGIRQCCYTVQDDAHGIPRYVEAGYERFLALDGNGTARVDLAGILGAQLATLGIGEHRVYVSKACTLHFPELYFSYRREKKEGYNMLSAIVLRP